MKIKTSVSIGKKAHAIIQRIARAQDRSVSYILEKFIEDCAKALPEKNSGKRTRRGGGALRVALACSIAAALHFGLVHTPVGFHHSFAIEA
jgi:hypothetical protein